MRERGYIALLSIAAIAVIVAFVVRSDNQRGIDSAFVRADSALRSSVVYRYDSLRFGSKFPPRKSRRVLSIDLNSADSASLCEVYGIGATFSRRIIERRSALGGFYEVEQLREVRGIDDEVYERIAKNFYVDRARIQKINVNFADRKMFEAHPCITPSMARRIIRARMEGGYITSSRDLLERDILLPNEARKVTHYLLFDTIVKP